MGNNFPPSLKCGGGDMEQLQWIYFFKEKF